MENKQILDLIHLQNSLHRFQDALKELDKTIEEVHSLDLDTNDFLLPEFPFHKPLTDIREDVDNWVSSSVSKIGGRKEAIRLTDEA